MKTEEKAEETQESTDLDHFKEQFEGLSIKDLRLVDNMVRTTLDLKQAKARHEGKFAKKKKDGGGMSISDSPQYRDPDEDYI